MLFKTGPDSVHRDLGCMHSVEETGCKLPLAAFLTTADGGTEADNVRKEPGQRHGAEQPQCQLPLLALMASANHGVEAGDIRCKLGPRHIVEQGCCQRPLAPPVKRANEGVEANDGRLMFLCRHGDKPGLTSEQRLQELKMLKSTANQALMLRVQAPDMKCILQPTLTIPNIEAIGTP